MSREAELYKDKIEVSLDGRQIFYLFFGGAVIVGLVFVLGVMVGRRVEARGHTDRARVAATVDPLAALDRLEGGSGLSFQGALRGAEGPITDVEKQIAEKAARGASGLRPPASVGPQASGSMQAKVEKKADAPKLDAKVDAKVDAKKDAPKVDAKADTSKADAKKDELDPKKADDTKKAAEMKRVDDAKKLEETKKLEAKAELKKVDDAKPLGETKKLEAKTEPKKADETKKLEAKTEPKKADEPKDEAKSSDRKLEAKKTDETRKTEEAKKTADKAASKPADKKLDEPKADKKYTLQLSSFQEKAEAQAYLESIKSAGYQAYVTEAAVDGKHYFRVRLGSYKSMEAATEAKAQVEKSTKKSAIVIRL
jgi:cell division septation protein DedD